MRRRAVGLMLAVAVGLAGCGEIDQKAKVEKIYAGKIDARAADDARFGGDRKKWEMALAERTKTQNEYLRVDVK